MKGTKTGITQRARTHVALISLRVNEGLSREALAYRAGISKETVRLAEAGFVPTPRVQFALAGVFGMRPLDLWPIETQKVFR
jgi:transcriptional regulator with XRE-family HTH domain